MTSIYSLEGVELVFRAHGRRVPVLSGLDLDVASGERLLLRGPSGSGKTTVLNLMAGFLAPTLGRVVFDGHDLREATGKEIAAFRNGQIGIVHQFFNLIPSFSALANAAAPLLVAGCSPRRAKEEALEMLDRVGVAGRAAHYPCELSGGERQRVAIARALVNGPRVILADEPTGNLDGATSAAVIELLDELAGDHVTVILATHDVALTSFAGRVVELGARQDVRESVPEEALRVTVRPRRGALWARATWG